MIKLEGVNVMLDLETLGKSPGCGVIQVGAVLFCERGLPDAKFHEYVRYDRRSGLHVDGDTLEWWFDQGTNPTRGGDKPPLELPKALYALNYWLQGVCSARDALRLWCHATFDIPVIEAAYRACGIEPYWNYRSGRDVRLILELADVRVEMLPGERKHNALDDAVAQARAVALAYQKLSRTDG